MPNKKETYVHTDLADWFYRLHRNEVVTRNQIADKIYALRKSHKLPAIDITDRVIDNVMTLARKYIKLVRRVMIYRVTYKGRSGYKLATPDEMATTATKATRKAILYADNAVLDVEIVKEKGYLPLLREKLSRELLHSQGRMRLVSQDGRRLLRVISEVNKNGGLLKNKPKEITYVKAEL